jgi:hypothetical protein
MGIIAGLLRGITSQLDSPRHQTIARCPDLRDRRREGARQWLECYQAVQHSPSAERQILYLAHRPGRAGCHAAHISPDWLRSIRSLPEPEA